MSYLPISEWAPYILHQNFRISFYILYISLFGISGLPAKIWEFPSLFNHSPYLKKKISLFVISNIPYVWIMALFFLRKHILQTSMRNHTVELDVWVLVGSFVYFHTSCVRTARALARLRGCAGSPVFAGRLCDKYHYLMSSWQSCVAWTIRRQSLCTYTRTTLSSLNACAGRTCGSHCTIPLHLYIKFFDSRQQNPLHLYIKFFDSRQQK